MQLVENIMNFDESVVAALGIIAVLLLGLIARRQQPARRQAEEQEQTRGAALGGKIEKLERALNELRTEALRSVAITQKEIAELKKTVALLKGESASTPDPSADPDADRIAELQADALHVESGSENALDGQLLQNLSVEPPVPVEAHSAAVLAETPLATEVPAAERRGLFSRLAKTRDALVSRIKGVLTLGRAVDAATLDELEEILITSDIGVATTQRLLELVKERARSQAALGNDELLGILRAEIVARLSDGTPDDPTILPKKRDDGPLVVMVVGVNGAGKTTTVAKLAHQWSEQGAKVLIAAADTFRAAAVDQLDEWAGRIGVPIVRGAPEAKPATVVFDAISKAKEQGVDVLLIDTAGRLHTKTNLMQELEGVKNVLAKHQPSAPHEVLLVLDGSTGQNALAQAREFNAAVALTGLVITKLDGTPKGGIVVAIKSELHVPIRYIGVGEKKEDLRPFNPLEFSEAIVQ